MKEKVSTAITQYRELKQKYSNHVVLFRCGDFYETFERDAKIVSDELGIILTWRYNDRKHDIDSYEGAMTGFPYHALDSYLRKLVINHRVAIVDQVLEPKLTKKLVKRNSI